ncbi:MAG TPA: hypothetical protein VHK69_05920, partial [Chitinophagaceae bacterium]|nr:hypothetical protein [Chitinophagaceae bacterium]
MRTVILFALFILLCTVSIAQSKSLDPTFGNKGVAIEDFGPTDIHSENHTRTIVLANGQIVVLFNGNRLLRYNSNGVVDSSFGVNGVSDAIGIVATEMEVQPDGKFILASARSSKLTVVRLHTNGILDNTFSQDGIHSVDLGFTQGTVYFQADGRIVVSGTLGGDFIVKRFLADGTIDNSFSNDGIVTNDFGGINDHPELLDFSKEGKIVVVGANEKYQILFAVYDVDGSLENQFFHTENRPPEYLKNTLLSSIAIQDDAKVIIGWNYFPYMEKPYCRLTRYEISGTIDSSFGYEGSAYLDMYRFKEGGHNVQIQRDSKIILVGSTNNFEYINGDYNKPIHNDFKIVRINQDGSLDNTFSGDGSATVNFTLHDIGEAINVQPDGSLLVTGTIGHHTPEIQWIESYSNPSIGLAKLKIDGTLDSSFHGDGLMKGFIPTLQAVFNTVATQNDGKLIVAGSLLDGGENNLGLVRYNIDGSKDGTFSGDGKLSA